MDIYIYISIYKRVYTNTISTPHLCPIFSLSRFIASSADSLWLKWTKASPEALPEASDNKWTASEVTWSPANPFPSRKRKHVHKDAIVTFVSVSVFFNYFITKYSLTFQIVIYNKTFFKYYILYLYINFLYYAEILFLIWSVNTLIPKLLTYIHI